MRKRIFGVLVIISFILSGLSVYVYGFKDSWSKAQEVDNNLIRFHVIANSDSLEDQALKRAVRDRLIKVLGPEFKKAQNIEEARQIIRESEELILTETKEEIKSWGKSYEVKLIYGDYLFPTKSYGDLVLPAGTYEALRVIIGEGKGQNWWCVLFPPLCFVDITTSLAREEAVPVLAVNREESTEIAEKEIVREKEVAGQENKEEATTNKTEEEVASERTASVLAGSRKEETKKAEKEVKELKLVNIIKRIKIKLKIFEFFGAERTDKLSS